MSVLDICNPVLTVQVLTQSFLEMDQTEYEKTLRNALERAEAFRSSNDDSFVSELDTLKATEYADICRTFLKFFDELKGNSSEKYSSVGLLANLIAWHQVLSTFRTLYAPASAR